MAENAKKTKDLKKGQKKAGSSWSKGLKTEWDKIVWTVRKTLAKQTGAVVAISAVVAVIIMLVDNLGLQIMELIIK